MIRVDQAAAILPSHILGNDDDGTSSGIETLEHHGSNLKF